MSLDNAGIKADALAGIAEAGFSVTFTQQTSGPTSPLDTTPVVTTDYPITAVSTKTSRAFMSSGQEIVVVKTLLIGATGFIPRQGDKVTISGYAIPFGVARVMPTEPGGVTLMLKVDLTT